MKTLYPASGYVLILTLLITACGSQQAAKPQTTLYERLGGKPAITAVVNDFVAALGEDTRLKPEHKIAPARVPWVKDRLVELVCQSSGGPCQYTGRDMKTTHAGMRISGAEFDAVVDDLVNILDKYQVAAQEKNELLDLLAPLRKDIVEIG